MTEMWYVEVQGQVVGPCDSKALQDMRDSGRIADANMASADRVAWVSVGELLAKRRDALATSTEANATSAEEPVAGQAELPPSDVHGRHEETAAEATGARDRIVILGRRAAGKTVFLSQLYAKLWRSLHGMTMSALQGVAHREAMRVVTGLAEGTWPPATLENVEMAFEIEHEHRKRLLLAMDYSGEVFKRVFVEDESDSPEARELLNHLDNAAAVMLLIDPSTAYEHSRDIDTAVDDDFGMVQAVKRIRNWPWGQEVPIVVVFSKMDKNRPLIQKRGGSANYLMEHWPALARALQRAPIFTVSAVQTRPGPDGTLLPRPNSRPRHVEAPLKYCLRNLADADKREEEHHAAEEREKWLELQRHQEERRERNSRIGWAALVIALLLVGAFVIGLIVVFYHP